MEYQLADGGILRKSDHAWIPKDENNTDYQRYQQWLKEGNKPDPEAEQKEGE